jgi:hypothetical protein
MIQPDGYDNNPTNKPLVPAAEGVSLALTEEQLTKLNAKTEILALIESRFQESSTARLQTEQNWLNAIRAYRGEYSPEELDALRRQEERNPGCSKIFVKVTKTKVQAAYGQLLEILFAGNKFPIGIEPTPDPEGIPEFVHLQQEDALKDITPKDIGDIYGHKGDDNELAPGTTTKDLLNRALGKAYDFLRGKKIVEGPSPDKTQIPQFSPAEEAAKNMEKVMTDQLEESNAEFELRKAILECVILGTGALKGPFNYFETCHYWEQDPVTKKVTYKPKQDLVPKIKFVSVWNLYPDPTVANVQDGEYLIEEEFLSPSKLRKLMRHPYVDKEAITRILKSAPGMAPQRYWENELQDSKSNANVQTRYRMKNYWGYLDTQLAKQLGMELSDDEELLDQIQVNIWVCNGEILRCILNPFTPQRIPYVMAPLEEHLYQIWGIGVPENMGDSQRLMNTHVRMAGDNLKLAGNAVFEVDPNFLVPGQDMTIYPGKIFYKQGGPPGQAIHTIGFNDTSQSHLAMYDKARVLADESTGIPSFSHGMTGVIGTGRTAAGISMLMSAAAVNIKTIVKNLDHYMLEPLGNALFQWNMQFNEEDMDIRGDVKIIAKGTTSLMQREVRTQRLLSLVQVASNPLMAPFLNAEEVFKEIAVSMDLDADKIVNDPVKAKMYAELVGTANGGPGAAPAGAQQGMPQGAPSPDQQASPDQTAGTQGAIGAPTPPQPGAAGYSGAVQ